MLDFLNFLAVLWCSICLLTSVRYILKHQSKNIHIVYIVFYIFFVIPIILDYLLGKPSYNYSKQGFYLATRDSTTSYIYALYISMIPLIWNILKKGKKNYFNLNFVIKIKPPKYIKFFLVILTISPFLGLLVSNNPIDYLDYAASSRGLLSYESQSYHVLLSRLCLLSVISVFILLFLKQKFRIMDLLIYFPWVFLAVWIHGKRSIVIIAVVIFTYLIWEKKLIRGYKLIPYVIVVGVLFLLFSNLYQSNFRYNNNLTNTEYIYDNIRIDYGRDDVTKLAIYSEVYPEKIKILEYRFQSFLLYTTFYIPREWWPNKPYPYDHYVTSALHLTAPQLWDSNMTTSILEESIANAGWIGMLLGPLIIILICRIGDATGNPLIRSLTILIASLLLVLHLLSFIVFVVVWCFMVLTYKIKKITQSL